MEIKTAIVWSHISLSENINDLNFPVKIKCKTRWWNKSNQISFFSAIEGRKYNELHMLLTCLLLVGAYICCSLFLAHIKGQVPRPLMNADYLTFVNLWPRTNKHLPPLLWTKKGIRSSCSTLKGNLKINFMWFSFVLLTSNFLKFMGSPLHHYKYKQKNTRHDYGCNGLYLWRLIISQHNCFYHFSSMKW